VTLSLLTFAYISAPTQLDAALARTLPGDDPVALSMLGA